MPALEACRCLHSAHPQAGQVGMVAVPPCGRRVWFRHADMGRARFQMGRARAVVSELALIGNGTEREGCDAGTRARELHLEAGLGPDIWALTLPYTKRPPQCIRSHPC
jgi:hypothetical protein